MIAKIAVSAANFAIDKAYSYRIPENMSLLPGQRVTVPFGRGNRRCEGVVLTVESGDESKLKSVEQILDEEVLVSAYQLRMAAFVRERYFCTFYDALRAMLPAGLWFQTKETVSLTDDRTWEEKTIKNEDAWRILTLLSDLGGSAGEDILRGCVEDEDRLQAALQYLQRKKWISAQADFSQRMHDKTERIATLASSQDEALEYAAHRPKSAAMQKAVLELLAAVGTISVKELCYFTGASTATVNRLEKLGYVTLSQRPVLRCREIKPAQLDGPLVLNEQQQRVFDGLNSQRKEENPGVALLYGVTGSGKTSVYIKLIQACLDEGKSAMLLVPEIALTPQLLSTVAAYFGDAIAVLHSSLSAGERYDQWKQVRSGAAKVVVGTRSAVFAPCENLGLVILDEEQEHSYKSENAPRYHAKEIAIWRGAKEKALVLLGSATPSVESMYRAKTGAYRLYEIRERFGGRKLPRVTVVDMREELKRGNDLSFSDTLRDAIIDAHDGDKQSIILLNRRGNSRALVCVDCRETPECPRCAVRLTYHSANNRLMCHYCGFSQYVPERCPQCGGPLKQIGTGTQKLQQELEFIFPDYEIARMDADTVNAVNTHEKILEHFKNDKVPVLIGTQMVAKGLNLPDVTLVGVLDADLSLYNDSFRAAETTFNMLTQVVGRAGRGDSPGQAVIQTLVPDHRIIGLAAKQDYDGFYDLEIELRKMQNVPPFGDILTVTFTGQEETAVLRGAAKFRDSLIPWLRQLPDGERFTLLGPAPCPVPKINYHFRYRLTLRGKLNKQVRGMIAHLLQQFSQDKMNRGVSAFADVNGYD